MPSFLSRSFSARKKDSSKTQESVSNAAPSSPSRFKLLSSKSGSRPPSSSSAMDGGASRVRGFLSRTPTVSRTGTRNGENSQPTDKPLSPPSGDVEGGVVKSGTHDRPVSPQNSKTNHTSAPIRGTSPQRVSSPLNVQRGPSRANRPTSPFPPSRTTQQEYQQQLRRSTASPPIPSRGPSRGPSPYNGPYPVQNHQWPTLSNAIENAENFNVVDFYTRQGTPKLTNPSRNSNRHYQRSQSMTSEPAMHYALEEVENFALPPTRSLSPRLEPGERRSSRNMRDSNANIASVMRGNRGPGGMGMGMSMTGLDGGLNQDIGPGNMQRKAEQTIPPMPRVPSMYAKPSAQSVRNQNQMMNQTNYAQYPPPFRGGKQRNNHGPEPVLNQQLLHPDSEGPSPYGMDQGQYPPRMQSPRHFQPPPRSHSTGPRRQDMASPPPHDRRMSKRLGRNHKSHQSPDMPLAAAEKPPSDTAESKSDAEQQHHEQQPRIPTALPTPSLTPTPPSRSNSTEDRQNSDDDSLPEEGLELPSRRRAVSEVNPSQRYQHWQDNRQAHGYFRRPPPYQMPDSHHHNNSPPSPLSAPTTPITSSSASSTHGNQMIAQQIQLAAPIMPGPVKENCYTKDISLVMEECMMGHGRPGRDSVMRRTANWQHCVGCMMCGGYGGPSSEKPETGPTAAGKNWLWLCSWCALRVCSDCRCRLGEEEDMLREKSGSAVTVRVDLRALRTKIIQEKLQEQEEKSAEPVEKQDSDSSRENAKTDHPKAIRESPSQVETGVQEQEKDVPTASNGPVDNFIVAPKQIRTRKSKVQQDEPFVKPPRTSSRPVPPVSTSSEESMNSFTTAGSHAETNGIQKNPKPAVETKNKKLEYPPRISSRNPPAKAAADAPNQPNPLPVAEPKKIGLPASPRPVPAQTKVEAVTTPKPLPAEPKKEVVTTPKPLPVETSTITTIYSSGKTMVRVSAPVIASPTSPESPSRKPLPASATFASIALQAAVADTPALDKAASAAATSDAPVRNDSSLRAVVSPEMLALITGIPVAEQSRPKLSASRPRPALPLAAEPELPARNLTASPIPPSVPAKSPPPSRAGAASPAPPKSSSSTLFSPLTHVKTFLTSSPPSSPPSAQNLVKRKTAPASPSPMPTVEKFLLPPLSFETEISREIDNIFGTRQHAAPKAQATHAEETYTQTVESSPRGTRRWWLFGGRR